MYDTHRDLLRATRITRSTECEDCGEILPKGKYMFTLGTDTFCYKCASAKAKLPERICDRIWSLRVANKYSQKDLAQYCEMQQSVLSAYELGRNLPGAEKLVTLAIQLNTTSDYLIGLSDNPNWREE